MNKKRKIELILAMHCIIPRYRREYDRDIIKKINIIYE